MRYAAGLADGGLFVRKVPALASFAEDAAGGWGELGAGARRRASRWSSSSTPSAFFGTSLAVDAARRRGRHRRRRRRVDLGLRAGDRHGRAEPRLPAAGGARRVRRPDARAARATTCADLDAKYADVVDLAEALAHLRAARTLVQRCDPHHDRGMDPLPRGHAPFATSGIVRDDRGVARYTGLPDVAGHAAPRAPSTRTPTARRSSRSAASG